MINVIKEKLKELDSNVLYGICKKGDTWDCLLIRKARIAKSKVNNRDDVYYVSVTIVREDQIPEGLEASVEKKMKEIGYIKSSTDARYEYALDANEVVVELCTMEFTRPTKRSPN